MLSTDILLKKTCYPTQHSFSHTIMYRCTKFYVQYKILTLGNLQDCIYTHAYEFSRNKQCTKVTVSLTSFGAVASSAPPPSTSPRRVQRHRTPSVAATAWWADAPAPAAAAPPASSGAARRSCWWRHRDWTSTPPVAQCRRPVGHIHTQRMMTSWHVTHRYTRPTIA